MKASIKKKISRIFKITGIGLGSILLLMFLLPVLFPDFVSDKIKTWANDVITSQLNFSKARLSFFKHFPALTLTLYDVTLTGSKPFEKDTLIAAGEIALGLDLQTVFSERLRVDQVFLTRANINVRVDSAGEANYNIYKTDTAAVANPADSGTASLKIERIKIEHSNLTYDDRSIPIVINAKEMNYEGKGDLSKAIFDLASHVSIGSFDLDYDGQHYIGSKKLSADLVTKINTSSLAFAFEKNDLKLNNLPVDFTGRFEFLEHGYNMDFKIHSTKGDLHDLFTALPPGYMTWVENTNAKGKVDVEAYLTGKYDADANLMPDLGLNMKIRNGSLNYKGAPASIDNIFLNFDTQLPSLNTDSLYVNIDSIYFTMGKDYFSSIVKLNNLNKPEVHAKINSEIDLEKWDQAMGFGPAELRGKYALHLAADGKYQTTIVQRPIRGADTIITSIPVFNLQSSLTNGYFKYAALPQAVNNISFNLNASCPDSNYQHGKFSVENLNATVLGNFIKGYFRLSNFKEYSLDAYIKTALKLDEVKSFYPLDSIDLKGNMNIDMQLKGNYIPAKKQFPVTNVAIKLRDGSVQTKYYPHPLEKIQVDAGVTNTDGTTKNTSVLIKPFAFEFEGQPFAVTADLKNLDDLKYDISSKGTIDIGRIYQVFSQKGTEISGLVKTDLSLKGLQSDATAQRYSRLSNSGTAEVKDLEMRSQYFPLPFKIAGGLFRFKDDKMWFDQFKAAYGKSTFTLNGYLSNVINYALKENEPLKGNFKCTSAYLLVDEFMAYAGDTATAADTTATGVVLVPANLSLVFNADVNKLAYNGLELEDFIGEMAIDSGKIKLKQAGFNIIGAPVIMDAEYGSLSPVKAYFNYHINAKEFDIKRAYNEIKLFRDLATSAAGAEGIVSLDYTLGGKLGADMHPLYPSLKGAGVLSVKKVKMNGFKLFSAVGKETGKDSISNPDLSEVNQNNHRQ